MQCLLQHDKKPWQLHAQAQMQLLQYPWPGNVRELENVMRRAMVLCSDHLITPAHLMFDDWLTSCHAPSVTMPAATTVSPTVRTEVPTQASASAQMPTEVSTQQPTQVSAAAIEAFMRATVPPLDGDQAAPLNRAGNEQGSQPIDLHSAARMNEHQVIMATLATTPSKTEAAKRLGISPRTLRYKLAQLREHGLGLASAAC